MPDSAWGRKGSGGFPEDAAAGLWAGRAGVRRKDGPVKERRSSVPRPVVKTNCAWEQRPLRGVWAQGEGSREPWKVSD